MTDGGGGKDASSRDAKSFGVAAKAPLGHEKEERAEDGGQGVARIPLGAQEVVPGPL